MEFWIQGYGSSLANHAFVLMKWTERKLKIWIIYLEVSNPCPHTRNQNRILFVVTEESVSESQNIYVNMVYKCIQFKTKQGCMHLHKKSISTKATYIKVHLKMNNISKAAVVYNSAQVGFCTAMAGKSWKCLLKDAFVIKAAEKLQRLNILISSLLKHHNWHTRAVYWTCVSTSGGAFKARRTSIRCSHWYPHHSASIQTPSALNTRFLHNVCVYIYILT